MPPIKVRHVVSFSSEDKSYPADNLLKAEGTSKWLCSGAGEKQVSAILQFEKASKINQVDIGNHGAAFVEVLVGRSSMREEEYQVLLVASSFMNPIESRSGQSINRVRMFPDHKLSKAVIEEKWDRVKVVCTQPFNKTSQYGLSFLKLHSPGDSTDGKPDEKETVGGFALKAEKEAIKAGSLFANRNKEKKEAPPLTGAAAARAASRLAEDSRPPAPSAMSSPANSSNQSERKRKQSTHTPSGSKTSSRTPDSRKKESPPRKKAREEHTSQAKRNFKELMDGVVFVLSGYQNPTRGDIRDKAMAMGAVYKSDWDSSCTHLICAFENTPKYNQVEGKGIIVDKKWVRDCYKEEKLLDWRRYRVGRAKSPPSRKQPTKPSSRAEPSESKQKAEEDPYGGSTDEESDDTEDEIEKVRAENAKEQKNEKSAEKAKNGHIKEEESGSEDDNEENLPYLPDFFTKKTFFLHGKFPAGERRQLYRYITAYNGCTEDYMRPNVNFVITNSEWDDNFDEALSENDALTFVNPAWIQSCHEKQKLIPYQKYIIVPK